MLCFFWSYYDWVRVQNEGKVWVVNVLEVDDSPFAFECLEISRYDAVQNHPNKELYFSYFNKNMFS